MNLARKTHTSSNILSSLSSKKIGREENYKKGNPISNSYVSF